MGLRLFAAAVLVSFPVFLPLLRAQEPVDEPAEEAAEEARGADAASALRRRLLARTPVMDDLRHLVDAIGGRPTGSEALDEAVAWAASRFEAAGLENVRTEPFTIRRGWVPGEESAQVAAGSRRERLPVAAMPFSASTDDDGLTAGVVDVGPGEEGDFEEAGSVRGRFVLVRTPMLPAVERAKGATLMAQGMAAHAEEAMIAAEVFARARRKGALGVLWASNRPEHTLYRQNVTVDGSRSTLPGVVIEHSAAERLAARLGRGEAVRVTLDVHGEIVESLQAKNVVAEIEGRERKDEVVILGAHLDSWDLGPGALDNGCNVALVLDVARQAMALVKAGQRPRRTLRFILYTGEELGLMGSHADVLRHRSALDRIRAQVVFDYGTGQATGFSLGGRPALAEAVDEALAPVEDLGPFSHTEDAFVGTDNYDYLVEGVPNLVANQDVSAYVHDYHASSDTLDKVDGEQLKNNAAIAGVLAWNLADAARPFGRRLNRGEVERLVRETGLDRQMKAFGLWDDFVSGARGRRVQ